MPLNLKDFKTIVDQVYAHADRYGRDDTEKIYLGIKVSRIGTAGGTTVVPIKSLYRGTDWDRNLVIINAESPLRVIHEDELADIQKKYGEYAALQLEVSNLRRETKKLREMVGKLEGDSPQDKKEPQNARNTATKKRPQKVKPDS